MRVSEAWKMVYEVVGEVVRRVVGVGCVEPVLVIENKLAVRPNVYTTLLHQQK